MARSLHLALGVAACGLAIAGSVLPLLPTTPFLLVAAWAFARSSPRLEARLLADARFGPLIADWRREGAIGRRAKRAALLAMAASLAIGPALGFSAAILALQAAVLVAVAIFLWTRPEPGGGGRP